MRYIVSLCFVLFTTPIAYPSDQTSGIDRTPKDAQTYLQAFGKTKEVPS
jgi:hypothetical protein